MATAVPAATENQEGVKKPPGGGCWHKGVGSRRGREQPDLVFPRGGPRAAHQLFQRRFRRPDQLLHDRRGQQGQPHQAAHLRHVDLLGIRDLGHRPHALLIQQPLPVIGQPEGAQ